MNETSPYAALATARKEREQVSARPNHSLHPGPATAGVVSPACASGSIVTHRAYNTCLRGPGELER